jgi:hypothetical protein
VFRRFFKKDETNVPIDWQIDAVIAEMEREGVNSERYPKLLVYLERLNSIKLSRQKNQVDRNTVINVVGSLVGIVMIIAYEQKHVLTSRSFSLLPRPK